MNRFRFSLQAVTAASRHEWVELARRVEGAGFDLLVTADHLGGSFSPLLALATAAEVTTALRLGVMVLNNDFHHPALLARDAATLDVLSQGRVELGLGAGHARPEYERAGIAFGPAGDRIARLAEAVQVLRRLLDGDTVTFSGQHYHLDGERCGPAPLQSHLPLLVGGGGTRVLGIGARHADAVGFTGLGRTLADGHRHEPSGFAPTVVDDQVAAVRTAAGDRLGALELQVLVQSVVITDRSRQSAEALSDRLPGVNVDDVLATPYLLIGSVDEVIERLIERRERWGFSHYTVRGEALPDVEPVVAALSGQ
ncbi:MAG: TIGR03621 family F420-dependent LLM class oxidoreductase [Acidimicrobiales bacterium]